MGPAELTRRKGAVSEVEFGHIVASPLFLDPVGNALQFKSFAGMNRHFPTT